MTYAAVTLIDGDPVPADVINDISAEVASLSENFNAGWIDYSSSFTITASTTSPTKGNSVYLAEYLVVNRFLVKVRAKVTMGSTWAAGSGNYLFSLPPGLAATTNSIAANVGSMWITDSGVQHRTAVVMCGTSTTMQGYIDGSGGPVGSGTHTWNVNDVIAIDFEYEPV